MMKHSFIFPALAAGILLPMTPPLIAVAKPAIIKPAKEWAAHEKVLLANFLPGMMPAWNRANAAAFTPAILFGTYSGFWLDAALGTCSDLAGTTPVTSDGTIILNWQDQSGNGRHFSRASFGPTRKNSIVNSLPVLRFAGNPERLDGATLAGLGTSAEIFAILKCNADPSPGDTVSGIWTLGTDISDHYPYTDGNAYMGAFSSARKSTGNPSATITAFHLLNIWSAASDWAMLINGTSHHSTATNSVGFSTAPIIGKAPTAGYYFAGDFAEIVAYNAKLQTSERTSIKSYFADKYSLTIV